jgi:hypothetical protein
MKKYILKYIATLGALMLLRFIYTAVTGLPFWQGIFIVTLIALIGVEIFMDLMSYKRNNPKK